MKKYFQEILFFLNNRFYCGLALLTTVIAYGYAATNITIGIDDVRGTLEIGEGRQVLASGRFSQAVLPALLGYHKEWIENSFAIDVFALMLLLLLQLTVAFCFARNQKTVFQ